MTRLLKILSTLVVASALALSVPVAANAIAPGTMACAAAGPPIASAEATTREDRIFRRRVTPPSLVTSSG